MATTTNSFFISNKQTKKYDPKNPLNGGGGAIFISRNSVYSNSSNCTFKAN
jgi:hypothetical protein